jgi:hypothetical protein
MDVNEHGRLSNFTGNFKYRSSTFIAVLHFSHNRVFNMYFNVPGYFVSSNRHGMYLWDFNHNQKFLGIMVNMNNINFVEDQVY